MSDRTTKSISKTRVAPKVCPKEDEVYQPGKISMAPCPISRLQTRSFAKSKAPVVSKDTLQRGYIARPKTKIWMAGKQLVQK